MFKWSEIKKELLEVYRYRYVVVSYIQSNLKLRYRRSVLGFLWTVLAPMLNYLVMGIVFSLLMRDRMDNYFVYYFSGAVFFTIISATLNRAPTFLISNEQFIRKIYIPKLIFVLNGTFYEIANFILSAISLLALGFLTGHLDLSWHSLLIVIPIFLLTFMLLGLGCIISIASVYFRDFLHIIPVIVQAVFFLTPVIYDKSMIPSEYQFLIYFNPFFYFLEIYRQPLVFHLVPSINYYLLCVLMSFGTFFTGIFMIKKFDNRIIFKL